MMHIAVQTMLLEPLCLAAGAIGTAAAKIWKGFGTRVLANDVRENPALEGMVEYVGLEELLRESHLVSLHCPLLPSTFHLLNAGRCASPGQQISQLHDTEAARRAQITVTFALHHLKEQTVCFATQSVGSCDAGSL